MTTTNIQVIIPLENGIDILASRLATDLYTVIVLDGDQLLDVATAEDIRTLIDQIIRFRRLYQPAIGEYNFTSERRNGNGSTNQPG